MAVQTECLGRLSWSPSAAACLGWEVLHRQHSLGHQSLQKHHGSCRALLGTGGFIFGFLESAVCLLCVSHVQLEMLLSVLLLEHCSERSVVSFNKNSQTQLQTQTSSTSGTVWGLLLPLRDGRGKGRSPAWAHTRVWAFAELHLSPSYSFPPKM